MIFNLFKSKPLLKELIPEGFVDIHSHILPGIDDGAKNVKESMKLISEMKQLGFGKIYATPHTYPGLFNNTKKSIYESYNKLRDFTKTNMDEIKISSEYYVSENIYKNIEKKNLLTIGSNHILIEIGFQNMPMITYDFIFKLQVYGYKVIFAHPERYLFLNNNYKEFYKLKKRGCLFQLNMLSLTGYYGKDVVELSEKLIKDNLIDFAGSDIHNQMQLLEFEKNILLKNYKPIERILNNNINYSFN